MATTASPAWAVAREFSSARWCRATASIPAPSRTAGGIRGGPHSTHAEGADADERSTSARGDGHHRGYWDADHSGDRVWDPRARKAGRVSRRPLRGLATDHGGGAHRELPLGAHLCVAPSGGVVRFPSGQDRGV